MKSDKLHDKADRLVRKAGEKNNGGTLSRAVDVRRKAEKLARKGR